MSKQLRAGLALAAACCAAHAAAPAIEQACFITPTGMGPIRIGMTLAQAKAALPMARFKRSATGDGVPMVSVLVGRAGDEAGELMDLSADEDDPDKPINWKRKISVIDTRNPACKTAEGVGPGMLAKKVEKIFGPTKEIELTEIESREYIEFKKQPRTLFFQLDNKGIYAKGKNRTRRFEPDASLFKVGVAAASDQ
ncbi:MAG TPA: hypothetical protein DCW29_08390 [Janthinobacterium sp.]|nr:hypothetical protein [Janthinobacterium sp.]